jgi:hypothetical protein
VEINQIEFELLERGDMVTALSLALELIEDGKPHKASSLLQQLIDRLLIDDAIAERYQQLVNGGGVSLWQ